MQTNQKPDDRELLEFVLSLAIAFPLFFSLLLPWLFDYQYQWWPLIISAVLLLQYAVARPSVKYVFRGWMVFAHLLGWINTRLLLGLTYYLVITPTGLVMRLFGRLQYRSRPTDGDSFYKERSDEVTKERLEQPF